MRAPSGRLVGSHLLAFTIGFAGAALGSCAGREPGPAHPPPAAMAQCTEASAGGEAGASATWAVEPSAGTSPTSTAGHPGAITHLQERWGEAEGLDYMEVVVGDVDIDARLPLVLGLHGLGDRPHVPDDAALDEPLAYRFIMPRAPDPYGAWGYTWLPVRVGDHQTEVLSKALADKADLLARFLETVRRQRPTVGRPIVAGGSQGGMLTFTLAVRHAELVAGAIPVMGWLPPPLVPDTIEDPGAYPPIWAVHGTADHVVPIEPTRVAVEALRKLGLDVKLVEFEGAGHRMTPAMDAQVKSWTTEMVASQWATAEGRHPAWR